MPGHALTDAEVEELLGAYALDACEPDEVAAVEAVLARRPDLAAEADRLARAAAWLAAMEAAEPPPGMRTGVLDAARARRAGPTDPVVDTYLSFAERLERAIADLPDDALDTVTANGLTAQQLVVHMAAQESLLAQNLGVPTVDDLREEEIEPRTHALLPRYAGDLDGAVALWRESVEANRAWAVSNPDRTAIWRGLGMTRDDTLLVRSFEAWIHADDLRAAAGASTPPPEARHLSLMSDLAGRILPLALAVAGRTHDGRTARLVLTGDGGGEWLVPMGSGTDVSGSAADPDVTVTADVVDWCRLVGDRITPDELQHRVDGDEALGRDLVAAAPVLATL
jgi:uncharacterized protein (TIGR03083 family)